ncbi:TPA: hypothetical protein N0F65_010806 [Lagenidium giganteum]|uniref:Uncharacterized protein n=1 Tax=Lagenidium giganteum TaxID=4803 RepID=A0AAV2YH78_9STRA|nr:TPA: hypothetical protein N0F65_010806 [Lagenidium giganteum]
MCTLRKHVVRNRIGSLIDASSWNMRMAAKHIKFGIKMTSA